jgi:hypothetical protein
MDTKKIMAIFAILMIALGIAGFAYAHWTETLTLNGTVKTGSLCLEWSFTAVLPDSNLKDLDGDGYKDDPVAKLTYTITDTDKDGCKDELNVTLENAYPSLWVNGTIDIHNCGTIPVGIHGYNYAINDPKGIANGIELNPWPKAYLVDPTGKETVIILEDWIAKVNQLDPGWSLKCSFNVHFGENTPEGATATISAWIEFWNWNEVQRLPTGGLS